MRFYGNSSGDEVSRIAAHARSLRELSIEGSAIEHGTGRGWGQGVKRGTQGRRSELDPSKYTRAAALVRDSPTMIQVRELMKRVGYKPDASGREKFLRSLFPFDSCLFTSEDDEYVGYLGVHEEAVEVYELRVAEIAEKKRKKAMLKKGVVE